MKKNNSIKLILFIYLILFHLSCDSRKPSEAEAANAITASKLQVYGNPIVNIVNIEDNIEVPFYALPLDQNGVFVSGVSISFEMLNETPGYLSEATLISDSSAVEQKFNIVPLSHLDTLGTFDFESTSIVRAYLENQSSTKSASSRLLDVACNLEIKPGFTIQWFAIRLNQPDH